MSNVRSGVVGAWYRQIWVGDPTVEWPDQTDGMLVRPAPPLGFFVHTGTHQGLVQLTIALGDINDSGDWTDDEVVELELQSTHLAVVPMGGLGDDDIEIELPSPGRYRVRVRARNRNEDVYDADLEEDEEDEVPEEAYLVELQPLR